MWNVKLRDKKLQRFENVSGLGFSVGMKEVCRCFSKCIFVTIGGGHWKAYFSASCLFMARSGLRDLRESIHGQNLIRRRCPY